MKKTFTLLAVACALFANAPLVFAGSSSPITIALFGSTGGNFTKTSCSFSTFNQTAATYDLSGNDFGMELWGNLSSAVTIPDFTNLSYTFTLTATYAGSANSFLGIDLLDANGNDRLYQVNFSSITQNSEVAIPLSYVSTTGAFNNQVTKVAFITGGIGSPITTLKLKSLVAVPEPSTYALCGAGLVLLLSSAFRRRRV